MSHSHDAHDDAVFWGLVASLSEPEADFAQIDAELWQRFGGEWAVMFTDLAGFSQRTQEVGITQFLRLIHRKRSVLGGLTAEYGGTVIKGEADSILAVFDTAQVAVECGVAMRKACQRVSEGAALRDSLILCIGVGYGRILKVGDSDVWGTEVNAASKLGEDIAQGDEILVTGSVRDAIGPHTSVQFDEISVQLPGSPRNYRVTT